MIRFKLLALGFLFFGLTVNAQLSVVKINGVLSSSDGGTALNGPGTIINLMSYKMGEGYFGAKVDSNGNFTYSVSINQTTLYNLKYGGFKMEVLLCPTEPEIKIEIKADSAEVKSMKVVGSHEYDAYREFKHADKAFKDKLHTLLVGCAKDKGCAQQLKKESEEFNKSLVQLSQTYKGTFAGDVLAPMDQMPEINTALPVIAQLREHFFDKANLSDAAIYTTSDMSYNLSEYLDDIADTTANGRKNFIEAMYAKTKNNAGGQRELISMFLADFMEGNREDYMTSLSNWAEGHTQLATEQPVLAMRFKKLALAVPGKPASEVTGTDVNDQEAKLSSVFKEQKLTLLLFWASDCPHCRASMPEITKMYEQYHSKGLEIFAVSLEGDKEKWKQFMTEKKLPWKNALLNRHDFSPNDYFLQFTPTLVLIDQKGVILHRFMSIAQFDKAIGKILSSKK